MFFYTEIIVFTGMETTNFRFVVLVLVVTIAIFSGGCFQPTSNSTSIENSTSNAGDSLSSNLAENGNRETVDEDENKRVNEQMSAFFKSYENNVSKHGYSNVFDPNDLVLDRMFGEYGAMFLTKAVPPNRVMFADDAQVERFQAQLETKKLVIEGTTIELQTEAANALIRAQAEAKKSGLDISPRGDSAAAKRSYAKTEEYWNGRVKSALEHWEKLGRISKADGDALLRMPLEKQIAQVFEYEQRGIYFSTAFDKSIIYSVAPPGTSQHLSMLALDIKQYDDSNIRRIMANQGWFRTVKSDEPHFTFLGYNEDELSSIGLERIEVTGGEFWIPKR